MRWRATRRREASQTVIVSLMMAFKFAGFPDVTDIHLLATLPNVQVAAGAHVASDADTRKRTQMIMVSETGDRATVAGATDAELKKHELFNIKLNQDGAVPVQFSLLSGSSHCWFPSGWLQLLGAGDAPGWALAMQAALRLDIQAVGARLERMETAMARLQNHNVNAPDDAIAPIPGAVAPFSMPADAVPPVHCPPNLEALSRLSAPQASVGLGLAPLEDVSSCATFLPSPSAVHYSARSLRPSCTAAASHCATWSRCCCCCCCCCSSSSKPSGFGGWH